MNSAHHCSVRIAAVQQILPHLCSDDESSTSRPDLAEQVVSSLPNLYCLRNPLDITLDTSNKSVLKVQIHIHRESALRYTYTEALAECVYWWLGGVGGEAVLHPVLRHC